MKYILTLAILFIAFNMSAQNPLNGALTTFTPVEPESYTGSPFYEKEFTQGVVKNSEGKSQKLLMRYDAVQDVVVLKLADQSNKLFMLPPVSDISYDLEQYTYKRNNPDLKIPSTSKYYANFYEGSKSHFIGVPKLDLNSKEKAKTGYQDDVPANFQVEMEYYLSVDGADFEKVYFRPKHIASLFDNSEMVNYIVDKKVKKPEDIVSLLKYYENLK
ncbi:hypothetical protein [Christiangramia portivictoriae]|uniref:hypothetical protein n=1 Tax=Christiangramia portivictoriae TaxID=326069 RepID=UPI00040E66D4|nr:hypothetical protein [Christiangramia portivictoriae]